MFCIGSTGDVRPYILLGRELKQRGHTITLASFQPFEDMVRAEGLAFFALSGDVVSMMNSIMKPGVVGISYIREMEKVIRTIAPSLLNDLLRAGENADAMICTFFGSAFYSVAEKYHIPCIQTHYFPMDPNPAAPISSAPMLHLGKVWNRLSYKIGYLLISLLEKRYLTSWRKENGMELRRLHTRPDYHINGHTVPVIYAVSHTMLPRPRGWGANIHISGSWFDEKVSTWTPPQELLDFLNQGEKPIYIGFGSMVSGDMNETFQKVLAAVDEAGVRAVISTGWCNDALSLRGSKNVYMAEFVPHDWLFPHVAAAVHHGGVGTTASSLRYGLPTLVIPFGGDQPFWGSRVFAMGCGPRPLSRSRLTVNSLAQRLKQLTTTESYHIAAEEISLYMRAEDGIRRAADLVEQEIAAWNKQEEER